MRNPIIPLFILIARLEITQNDKNPKERNNRLVQMFDMYERTRGDGIGPTPMVTGLPQPEDRIRIAWLVD